MCSAPVTEPTGVSSVSDVCLSDVCLSVYTHPLDAEAEGSDRRALSMFRGRSVRRHDFPRLYLLPEVSSIPIVTGGIFESADIPCVLGGDTRHILN